MTCSAVSADSVSDSAIAAAFAGFFSDFSELPALKKAISFFGVTLNAARMKNISAKSSSMAAP